MDDSSRLAHRFAWADVVLHTLRLSLGDSVLRRSALCNSEGSDSDFTGGAASWEHASDMLCAAASRSQPPALLLDLAPRTFCASWFS